MMVIDKLTSIIKSVKPGIDLDNIDENTTLSEDLGIDSLTMLMIAMRIEDEFGIQFESQSFKTVGEVCNYIESHT